MAGRRGYRPPGNYDPRRGKKGTGQAAAGQHRSAARSTPNTGTPEGGSSRRDRADNDRTHRGRVPHEPVTRERVAPLPTPLPAPLAAKRTSPTEVLGLSFSDLGLGGNILRALAELGATQPFAIQAVTIPDALAGHHLLGRARTGSGKTIAFGAALVERLLRLKAQGAFPAEPTRAPATRGQRQARPARSGAQAPKALILAPTRELALQIDRTVQPIARSVGFFTGQFVGGQPFEPQLHALKRGVDIAIGTPGRIEDLSKRGHLNLSQVAVTVIDEADHMAELGFLDAVQRVLRETRTGGQRLLFSATLDTAVDALVAEFMPRPAMHEIVEDGADTNELDWRPSPNVEHTVHIVLREHKDQALVQLTNSGGRSLVFCRTRAYAEHVASLLEDAGLRTVSLHGDLSQARRERNLAKFAEGRAEVLVATDVAARGIHVDDIDLVLQADPPDDPKAYVHRAGRTGRVGRAGRVVTLIPRTRQQRTRELFAQLGFEPAQFGDFVPEGADLVRAVRKKQR